MDDKRFEIVDGQQRIRTIWNFRDNKFALDGSISGSELDGKRYRDLAADLIEQFDNFQLTCVLLINYDDEKTRELFSKLQRGKPLNPAEKLNAFPGKIVPTMRAIGGHGFFKKIVFSLRRYKAYHIAAKLMLLEDQGISDISPKNIYQVGPHLTVVGPFAFENPQHMVCSISPETICGILRRRSGFTTV